MISKQDVQHIAKLARIKLTEEEIKKFGADLSSILDYFKMLKEVDTDKVEPTFHPSEIKENVMREDKAKPDNKADVLIKQAPAEKDRYIKVKAVFK